MNKLSIGLDATLGNYREIARLAFGEDSPAVAFLDKKIAEQGADEEVIAPENQMLLMLATIHDHSLGK
jgi:hypothetical protein